MRYGLDVDLIRSGWKRGHRSCCEYCTWGGCRFTATAWKSPTETPNDYNEESRRQDKALVKCWRYHLRMRKVWAWAFLCGFIWGGGACAKNFTRIADLSAHIYSTNASMRSKGFRPCSCLLTYLGILHCHPLSAG